MATVVGDIAIKVGADVSPLVTNLGKGRAAVTGFGSATDASAGRMRAWSIAGAAMGAAIAVAGLGFIALTKRVVDQAGALHDASAATGVHVASLQAMSQVAQEAGGSQEQLIASLAKMQSNIAGLLAGTKAQTEAFNKMGMSASDLAGLNADEQFARIAEALMAMADPTERTAAAMDAFGKSGASLLPMMEGYRNAVAEAAAHQERLGLALSDADAEKMDALGDSMSRLKDSALGAATQFAITFGPGMQLLVDGLSASMMGLNAMFSDLTGWLVTTSAEVNSMATGILMKDLAAATSDAADMAEKAAIAYQGMADGTISSALLKQADSLKKQQVAFDLGAISAEDYKARVTDALQRLNALYATIGRVNESDMSGAIGAMEGYLEAIGRALGGLIQLKAQQDIVAAASATVGGGQPTLIPDGSGGIAPGVSAGNAPPATVIVGGAGSGGSGGGGGSAGNIALEALIEDLKTEQEILTEWYAEKMGLLNEATEAELAAVGGRHEALERLQQEHQDRLMQIDKMARDGGQAGVEDYFGVLADTFAHGNERLQKISRTFGAAEALINAYRAASQTLADPSLPFFAKFAAAAAVLGQGLAFVSAIKGGSGGGGGGSSAGSSGGAVAAPGGPQSVANIYFHGQSASGDQLASLFAQINDGLKQGRVINFVQMPA